MRSFREDGLIRNDNEIIFEKVKPSPQRHITISVVVKSFFRLPTMYHRA